MKHEMEEMQAVRITAEDLPGRNAKNIVAIGKQLEGPSKGFSAVGREVYGLSLSL